LKATWVDWFVDMENDKKPKKPMSIAKPSGPRLPSPSEVGTSPVGMPVAYKPTQTEGYHDMTCMCASCQMAYPMPRRM
jgi:hypothetical protein